MSEFGKDETIRLIKLLNSSMSENEHVALASIRKANAILSARGVLWDAVIRLRSAAVEARDKMVDLDRRLRTLSREDQIMFLRLKRTFIDGGLTKQGLNHLDYLWVKYSDGAARARDPEPDPPPADE